jgi:HAD superfamily hydrolase (TIGR01509 family)
LDCDLKDLKAVVFDMDGLLLDTERISLETFVAACREYCFEPDLAVYHRCIGTNSIKTKEILIQGYGPAFPYDAVNALWREKYNKAVLEQSVPLKPAVVELLRYLDQNQIKKAVVTSTRQDIAVRELRNAGVLNYFEFVLGGDQIASGKPHPEIYQKACRNLGLPPQRCLALEDSDNGVRSAASAGLQVIQVRDLIEPSAEVRALGHPVVDSLAEVQILLKG